MLNTANLLDDANQNYNELSPHTIQNGRHQKSLQTINAEEGVEKRELSYTVGENLSWYSHYGKQYEDSSKTKSRIAT